MNFADPQAAISTLVDLDGGFDAYSVFTHARDSS
jgi:hypothetical protein